jgi:hypothetical protein
MPSNLPIVRSAGARGLFLASVAITLGIVFWTHYVRPEGLTAIFFVLFARMDNVAALGALLILVVAALVSDSSATVVPRWIGAHPGLVALGTGILLCAGSLFVYENHPLSMDEYAQYFQSQLFAHQRLAARFPQPQLDWLIPQFFQNHFLVVSRPTGEVASAYWPSFALLLTPFTLAGIPWALNPVISALTLLVIHRLALRLFHSEDSAGLAVLLTIASPVFFANGISYYSMPAHLLANSVYALLLLQPTPRRALVAGLTGSIALTLHNPVPHLLFAVPWLVWVTTRPGGIRLLGCLVAGYLPLCVLLGVGWFWFSSGLAHAGEHTGATGAQLNTLKEFANVFTVPSSASLLARSIGLAKIWIWAVPGLLILAAAGAWKWRQNGACRALAASALLTLVGYYLYPIDQGHGWGYRYFHSAWLALPLLGAGVFVRTQDGEGRDALFEDVDTRVLVVGCALLTLVFGIGLRALQIRSFMTFDQQQVPAYAGTERRVVLIDPSVTFYGQDLVQNDPLLEKNEIRMITHGTEADTAMMDAQFPTMRRVYQDKFGTVWSAAGAAPVANDRH